GEKMLLCIHSVGQVPPGNGRWPVGSPRQLHVPSRTHLALIQSIGRVTMWNMAYGVIRPRVSGGVAQICKWIRRC
ncbi:hypothetical protein, partial [Rhodopirellula baltica]|uniref:hypothetical protein n=1 Tax=Rhodopirellula baltica TaxID=265606 RepID=UPI001F38984E